MSENKKSEHMEAQESKDPSKSMSEEEKRSWALSKKIVSNIHKAGIVLLAVLLLLYLFLIIMISLTYAGVISVSDPLYGLDFTPHYLIFYFMLLISLLGIIHKRYKTAFLALLVYAIFFISTGDHSIFLKKNTDYLTLGKVLSVGTLNINHYAETPDSIAEVLNKYNLDFILLQNTRPLNTVTASFASAYNIFTGKFSDLAILSKYPIIETHEIMLPSRQAFENNSNTPENQEANPNRYFIHAIADADGIKINLLSIKLISGQGTPFFTSPYKAGRWLHYIARTQYLEADLISKYINNLEGPVIFGGDMSAPKQALSMKFFNKKWTDSALSVKVFPHKTFNSGEPKKRYDYIFCNNSFIPLYTGVDPAAISDHLIMYSVLGVKKN